MGIPADCDICKRSFFAEPGNIIDVFQMEDWENPSKPEGDPDDYFFVCRDCEDSYVHYWDDGT